VICNALDLAVDRQLIDTNPARRARPPKPTSRSTVPAIWNAQQLGRFLTAANRLRFYPASHLAAHTGMRRGELAGLNWGDLDVAASSLSITRTRQATMGRNIEGPEKTRTSRRRIDLDPNTVTLLEQWRHRLIAEGATLEPAMPMFLNTHHRTPSPETLSQAVRTHHRHDRAAPDPVPRSTPHARVVARRRRRPDQGCLRAARSRQPRLHDAHLPAPAGRHGCRSRQPVRRPHRHEPADVYRPVRREPQVNASRVPATVDDPVDDRSVPGTSKARKRYVSGPS
jgi:integrase